MATSDRAPVILGVDEGFATFGPELVELRGSLERKFLAWAAACGAAPMLFPPVLRIADLERLDYFRNFPQLPLFVTPLQPEALHATAAEGLREVGAAQLAPAGYVLPSAACYSIYLHLAGTVLEQARYVTTVASCFRNEERYEELKRLHGFTMREIVCLGSRDEVQAHLRSFKARIQALGEALGLGLTVEVGSDPFYQPQSPRARMQQIFPQKEELLFGGSVAIASVNFHRNFFGERCGIRTADGEAAFTGCVAFGIERWIHALLERFSGDAAAAAAALAAA